MKTKHLISVILLTTMVFISPYIKAQMFAESVEGDYVISYTVNQINQYISRHEPNLRGKTLYERLAMDKFYIRGDSVLVNFQINEKTDFETVEQMNRFGAKFHRVLEGDIYFAGFVQIDSLLRFPSIFPQTGIRIQMELDLPTFDEQGPERINSNTYETGGVNPNAGSGRSIAILDGQFDGFNFAQNDGLVPSTFTYYNCETGTCVVATIPGGGSWQGCWVGHGTRTTQTVFHHAPAATYRIYNTPTNAARAAAIQHATGQGVNVITCSESGYNTGWNDNSGVLCNAVNAAAANNILMFFSAGNRAGTGAANENGSHWQGAFNDNGSDFHRWDGVSIVNNRTTLLPRNERFHVDIQCNNDGGGSTNRYQIQFINTANNNILASQSFSQAASLQYTCNIVAGVNLGIRVRALTTFRPEFEMWTHNAGQYQFFSNNNQTSSPGNCTNNPRLITVAAVEQADYHLANPSTMWYSSRGPTNNNNNSVGLASPTNTNVACYSDAGVRGTTTYGGTSAATPNVAGAATAFWSKHPGLTANHVRNILIWKANDYKDWGQPGYDTHFGWGGAYLFSYFPNNIYLHQISGISGTAPSNGVYPWYSLKDIHNLAPNGRNVIMLNNDSETAPFVITKTMTINAIGNPDSSKRVD